MNSNMQLAPVIPIGKPTKKSAHLKRQYEGSDRPSFSVEQLKTFLHTAETFGRRGALAMFLVGFAHGCRVSEIADLKVSDIDFDGGKILIRRLKNSNNSRQALQAVNGYDEATVLQAWLLERAKWLGDVQTDVLFPSQKASANGLRQLSRTQIFRLFQDICFEAGIPKEYRHVHVLRHTAGQLLYDNGARLEEIQMVLGHRSINSTTIYAKPHQDQVSKKVADIFKTIF